MSTASPPLSIGLIMGSPREQANSKVVAHAIAQWVSAAHPNVHLEVIDLVRSPGHPLPLVIADVVPMAHDAAALSGAYPDPAIAAWSRTVTSLDAILICTPQYNWSFPAVLKNALDHLYHEWAGKPVALVTVGSRGGNLCHDALKTVLGGALHMSVVGAGVEIKVPRAMISGTKRWKGHEEELLVHREPVMRLAEELVAAAKQK